MILCLALLRNGGHYTQDIALGFVDQDGDSAALLGNPAEAAQEPSLAYARFAGDVDHKPAALVVNAVQEIAPEKVQFLSPADKLVLASSL
jgi:hypothetical protein